ncbi:MAG TPA: LEPR-XLL domain-containing protein, partial [Candidatus Limnocylindria bacterium]|nr:LEPR-XLL domain-containing protein [Candidatus Limnocylindria bacterium]
MNTERTRQFDLEALEPRILLSGDALLASVAGAPSLSDSGFQQQVEQVEAVPGSSLDTLIAYNPTDQIVDIFDGLESDFGTDFSADFSAPAPAIFGAKQPLEVAAENDVANDTLAIDSAPSFSTAKTLAKSALNLVQSPAENATEMARSEGEDLLPSNIPSESSPEPSQDAFVSDASSNQGTQLTVAETAFAWVWNPSETVAQLDDEVAASESAPEVKIFSEMLVDTLTAANGPPTQVADSQVVDSNLSHGPSAEGSSLPSQDTAFSPNSEFNSASEPDDEPLIVSASTAAPNLDLSGISNLNQTITIQVNADGTLNITGTGSGDDGTNVAGITNITGNHLAKITLLGPNLDSVWDLAGLNAGTLTPSGLSTIAFSAVQNLSGGTQKDTFVIDQATGVTGGISGGVGAVALQLFEYFFVEGDFAFQDVAGDLRLADSTPGGTLFDDVTYKVLAFGGTPGASAFVGNNGPASNPAAFGLSITNVNFTLLMFTDAKGTPDNTGDDVKYTALKASGESAGFVGSSDINVGVYNFAVELNKTNNPALNAPVLDFKATGSVAGSAVDPASFSAPVTPVVGAPALDFEGEAGALIHVAGNLVLNAFGYFVAKGGFDLALGTIVTGDAGTGPGVTLANADVLSLTLTSIDLWAGDGGSLNNGGTLADFSDDLVVDGAKGFAASVSLLKLVSIKQGSASYLGVESGADAVSADLVGFGPDFELHFWNGELSLNRKSGTATDKLDWDSLNVTSGLTPVTLGVDETLDLHVAGGVLLNAGNGALIARASDFILDLGEVSGNDTAGPGGDTAVTFTDADVLSLTLTDASLWAGQGGSINNSTTPADFSDADIIPGTTGFLGSITGSLSIVSIDDQANGRKYLGVQTADDTLSAGLLGVDAVALSFWSGTLKLNQVTPDTGEKLDWTTLAITSGTDPVDLAVAEALDLHIDGAAVLNIASGAIVAKSSDLILDFGKATTSTANGSGNVSFTDADVFRLTLSNAALFVGKGGKLEDVEGDNLTATAIEEKYDDDVVATEDDAIGFHGEVGSLDLIS